MNDEEKSKVVYEIIGKKNEVESYLKKLEKAIYDNETKYLESTQTIGNVIKGWEQIFTAKSKISAQAAVNGPKRTKFSNNERVFSQSSFNNQFLKEEIPSLSQNFFRQNNNPNIVSNKNNSFIRKKKKIMSSLSLKKKNKLNGNNFNRNLSNEKDNFMG